jgi:Na+-transporting methylmalonyl-CoA/oxaloacetate decarboxylase beta subunit
MKEKSKSEVSIIGGADGPTSIFIAGRTRKKPLKVRILKKSKKMGTPISQRKKR